MRGPRTVVPLAGLGFAAAVLAEALAFPDGASSSDPPAAIADYYRQHGGTDLVVDHISLVALPLLLLFLCGAVGRLTGTPLRFAQAAVTVATVFELAATAVEMTLAAGVAGVAPPATTAALFGLSSRMFFLSTLWLGLAVGTVAAAGQTRRWLRRLGTGTGTVLVVAGLSVAHPHGPLSVALMPAEALLVIWVIAMAVAGLRESGRRPVDDPAPAQP